MITRTVRGRTYTYSHTLGFLSNGGRGFRFPMDMALGRGDELYVLNRGDTDASVTTTARVTRCTVEEEYLGVFGSFGSGNGQFMEPTALALDREGERLRGRRVVPQDLYLR